MFKKKAFFISLALLASNFLLPNQVRSIEEREEFISETQEFNFVILKQPNFYEGYIQTRLPFGDPRICSGRTFAEFKSNCIDRISRQQDFYLFPALNELLITLEEKEEDVQEDAVVVEEEEVVVEEETTEAEDIDFDSITVESLPYSVDCPPKNKDLKIKQNKKEKFVVRFAKGKKFYKGLDFDEAVDVFEETYEDKCVE